MARRVSLLSKQPEPTRFVAGDWRQAGAARRIRAFCSLESLCHPMFILMVSSFSRDSQSPSTRYNLCGELGERWVEPSFLTISAERRHQIDGTVSEDHLHSTWWQMIPRCGSHTSNIIDWLRLGRGHPTSYKCQSCLGITFYNILFIKGQTKLFRARTNTVLMGLQPRNLLLARVKYVLHVS